MLANTGLLGGLVAIAFAASAMGHLDAKSAVHRVYGVVWLLAAVVSSAIWSAVPLLAAPELYQRPAIGLYLALPAAGGLAGAVRGWSGTARSRPEWRDLVGESLLFAVVNAGMLFGPGAVSAAQASALLPVAWIPALNGGAPYPPVEPALAALLWAHWKYLGIALAFASVGAMLPGGLVVGLLRLLGSGAPERSGPPPRPGLPADP